jgi:hypothetical protein
MFNFARIRLAFSGAVLAGTVLAGSAAFADSLTVAWDPSADEAVSGYLVWIGTRSNDYTRTVDVGPSTMFTLPDAVAGQQYFFRVVGYAPGPIIGTPSAEVSGFSNAPPRLAPVGAQTSTAGVAAVLQLSASDPYGDVLRFSATGLPPGLTINSTTGRIDGTPTTGGTYNVTVTVFDGVLGVSQAFTWTVTGAAATQATLLSPLGSITTTTPAFSWTAASGAASYQLEVRDGTGRVAIGLMTTASAAGCATGGTCRIAPGIALPTGAAKWQVQTITATGSTAWSHVGDFTVPAPQDTTAPTIVITSPTTASSYVATMSGITIGGTAGDNVAVSAVTWVTDRGASGTASGTSAWTATVPLQAGANTIMVSARDAAGNASARPLTVTYSVPDTTPPSLAISVPSASPFYSAVAMATLSGSAADSSGISTIGWTNGAVTGIATGTTSWTATVPLQLGTNTINVIARDAAGNITTRGTSVIYTQPATLLSPTGSSATPVPAFTWNASPVVTAYVLRVDDATQAGRIAMTLTPADAGCATGSVCTVAPGVTLSPGFATWTVQTMVGTGGVSSAPATFAVAADSTPPVVTILEPTTKSSMNASGTTLMISGTARDRDSSIVKVTWSTDRGVSGMASGTNGWAAVVPLSDGLNVVTISAVDSFGNVGSDVITIGVHKPRGKK